MFTAKIQIVNRKGKYETLESANVAHFDLELAKATVEAVEELNQTDVERPFRAGLYIKDEPVPHGWASRELPFSTQIWLQVEMAPADACERFKKFAAEYAK